jgi:sugar (pentulose or hexulose) kinase
LEITLSKRYVLTVDFGTQSVRAIIFDNSGETVAKKKIEYDPYFSINPGWAEQYPETYWKGMCNALKSLKLHHAAVFRNIDALVITTLRDSAVNMDVHGKVIRPSLLWLDQRMAYSPSTLMLLEKYLFRIIGFHQSVELIHRNSKSNWIIENEPEIWDKTHKYLLISGYIHYRLTGEFVDSIANQVAHIPFDYKGKKWAHPIDFKWRLFNINRSMLPVLVRSGDIIGEVSAKASKETGLRRGLHIVAGGSDKGCETVGAGCIDETMANISFGTTASVQITTKKYIEVVRFIPPFPALIPDAYNPEVEVYRGYWMVNWFKNEFGMKEVAEAKRRKVSPESLLDRLLHEVPPGCHGLMLQPLWSPDILNPEAKGSIIGFGDIHNRSYIYRSIIEGINYSLHDGVDRIEKKTSTRIQAITVSGGGSQSDDICQITADMFNRIVKKSNTHETSGLGASIAGFVGLKEFSSWTEAIQAMVKYKKEFFPNKENAKLYTELYSNVYKRIYSKLQPLYRTISKITGYPEIKKW